MQTPTVFSIAGTGVSLYYTCAVQKSVKRFTDGGELRINGIPVQLKGLILHTHCMQKQPQPECYPREAPEERQ